jgi:imidazolonepropionase-like amidohydrolase
MKRILLFSLALVAHAQTTLLFEHVTPIDGTGRPAKADSCILTAAGKIERVGACPIPAPSDAQTIDGRGKFVIPGMMDVHIHLVGGRGPAHANSAASPGSDQTAIRALHSYLYSGFTTSRTPNAVVFRPA